MSVTGGAARCVAVAWDGGPGARDAEAAAGLVAAAYDLPVVRLQVAPGRHAAHALREAARRVDPLWVAVGSTHRGPLGRVMPGSTALRLVRAGVAVIVPPRGYADDHPPDVRVIAAGFDGSAAARAAVRRAADLAERAGATLRVRTVADALQPALERPDGLEPAERLRDLAAELPPAVRPDARIVPGEAAQQLLAESDRGADLIVVGSHRYGPLLQAMLGSVGDRISERSEVPVAILPDGVEA